MRLILVRHGETAHNRDRIALGRADLPLTELGVRQARALAGRLSREPLTAVYSSPLQRAVRTAEAIAVAHQLPVGTDDRLIEMDVGEVEGLTFAEISKRHPELRANWGGREGPVYRMPGSSERLVDVQKRARDAVRDLMATHENEAICVVSHNFVILGVLSWAIGIDLSEFRRLRHEVAAISTLDVTTERITVLSVNDTCHLSAVDN